MHKIKNASFSKENTITSISKVIVNFNVYPFNNNLLQVKLQNKRCSFLK